MTLWQSAVKVTAVSLVSGLVVVTAAALLNLRPKERGFYQALLSRREIIYLCFLVLALVMPIAFSLLLRGTLLSPEVLGAFVRDLLVSVAIVTSFGCTWRLLDDSELNLHLRNAAYEMVQRLMPLPHESTQVDRILSGFDIEVPSLSDALLAWDLGEISQEDVNEIQLMTTLEKWIEKGDETAWYELREEIRLGDRLQHLGPRLMVERELWRLQHRRQRWRRPEGNGGYRNRLKSLVGTLSVPSLNDALLAWDRGEISQEKVREIQLLETLEKLMWQGDQTALYELQEEVASTSELQRLGISSICLQ